MGSHRARDPTKALGGFTPRAASGRIEPPFTILRTTRLIPSESPSTDRWIPKVEAATRVLLASLRMLLGWQALGAGTRRVGFAAGRGPEVIPRFGRSDVQVLIPGSETLIFGGGSRW